MGGARRGDNTPSPGRGPSQASARPQPLRQVLPGSALGTCWRRTGRELPLLQLPTDLNRTQSFIPLLFSALVLARSARRSRCALHSPLLVEEKEQGEKSYSLLSPHFSAILSPQT